jgi:hypothetical protein
LTAAVTASEAKWGMKTGSWPPNSRRRRGFTETRAGHFRLPPGFTFNLGPTGGARRECHGDTLLSLDILRIRPRRFGRGQWRASRSRNAREQSGRPTPGPRSGGSAACSAESAAGEAGVSIQSAKRPSLRSIKGATVKSASSRPSRCAVTLDQRQSCARATSRARTGFKATVRAAATRCSSSITTEPIN